MAQDTGLEMGELDGGGGGGDGGGGGEDGGDDEGGEGGEEKEDEPDDEELAWDMLESARAIYAKMEVRPHHPAPRQLSLCVRVPGKGGQAPVRSDSGAPGRAGAQAATRRARAALTRAWHQSKQTEQYQQAYNDLEKALEVIRRLPHAVATSLTRGRAQIHKQYLPPYDRTIAGDHSDMVRSVWRLPNLTDRMRFRAVHRCVGQRRHSQGAAPHAAGGAQCCRRLELTHIRANAYQAADTLAQHLVWLAKQVDEVLGIAPASDKGEAMAPEVWLIVNYAVCVRLTAVVQAVVDQTVKRLADANADGTSRRREARSTTLSEDGSCPCCLHRAEHSPELKALKEKFMDVKTMWEGLHEMVTGR
jgi:hypothetical protein